MVRSDCLLLVVEPELSFTVLNETTLPTMSDSRGIEPIVIGIWTVTLEESTQTFKSSQEMAARTYFELEGIFDIDNTASSKSRGQ